MNIFSLFLYSSLDFTTNYQFYLKWVGNKTLVNICLKNYGGYIR